jgi:hypothetical protein
MSKKLKNELNKIKQKLAELKKEYGDKMEVVYFASSYEDDKYLSGVDFVNVVNLRNYKFYKNLLESFELNHKEWCTFKDLIHLDSFKVVCINDNMEHAMAEVFEEAEGDWIELDKVYTVKKTLVDAHGNLTFEIYDGDYKLQTPEPYIGYSSTRFQPVDYTMLN